jgi:hypothetical protein
MWVEDPRSGSIKKLSRIPDPVLQVIKAPVPRSGSATLKNSLIRDPAPFLGNWIIAAIKNFLESESLLLVS